jgi:hypothetical protein
VVGLENRKESCVVENFELVLRTRSFDYLPLVADSQKIVEYTRCWGVPRHGLYDRRYKPWPRDYRENEETKTRNSVDIEKKNHALVAIHSNEPRTMWLSHRQVLLMFYYELLK